MPKFKKKPRTIEAVQWTGDNPVVIAEFLGYWPKERRGAFDSKEVVIHSLSGDVVAGPTDWVVRGKDGGIWVYTDAELREKYEEVT